MKDYTDKEVYYILVNLIRNYGEKYKKKHGRWWILRRTNESFYQMDDYNKSIIYKQGDGEYNYHVGFSGDTLIIFGIDFGSFKLYVPRMLIETHIDEIKRMYNSKNE